MFNRDSMCDLCSGAMTVVEDVEVETLVRM